MATPTIMALAQPLQGNVLIQINWSATPAVDFARVQRVETDGTLTTVRPNTSVDSSGEYMELSGGMAILYDTEAPFDVALTYITDGLGDTTDTATSAEVILQAAGNLWLKDPLNPANNLRVGLSAPPNLPECVPGEGIFFAGMGDRNYGVQGTNWSVNNRSTPIPLTQVRALPTSSLPLILRTFGDMDKLRELVALGTSLLLNIPAKYGYEGGNIAVGDVTVSRVSRDYTRQWQIAVLPYTSVGRPGGLSNGVLGTRWVDVCSVYPTFGAATAANVSWQQLLLGQGSTATPPAALRSWAQVNSDFATWSAYNSGGRTWQSGLEGH